MHKSVKAFALMQLAVFMAAAQQYDWKADFHYFFDNTGIWGFIVCRASNDERNMVDARRAGNVARSSFVACRS